MRKFAFAMALLATAPAYAATVQFSGDTTGDPTFNRPSSLTTLSAVGTDVEYDVLGFTVDVSGDYTFNLDAVADAYDPYLLLYQLGFDPESPLTNIVALDDDGGPGANSQLTFALLAGTEYYSVHTGFDKDDSGAWILTVAGAGTATPLDPTGVVPEPASWAMMLAGFGAVGYAMRRKSSARRELQAA